MSTRAIRYLFIVLFSVMIILDGYQTWRIANVRHDADFPAYLSAAQGIVSGYNPYKPPVAPPHPFLYPLFLACLWIPFVALPFTVASLLWFCISVAILYAVLHLLFDLLQIKEERVRLILMLTILMLNVSIIQSDFMYGQINLLILLLVLLGVKTLENRPSQSAIHFGLAISMKLMPIMIWPIIAFKRPRLALFILVAVLVFSIGIPFLLAGRDIFGYYSYWINNILRNEHGELGYISFDLPGVIAQLAGMVYPPILLRVVCLIILSCFPLMLLQRNKQVAAYFLALLILPLTSTHSENHHLVVLIPALGLVAATLIQRHSNWKAWGGLVAIQLSILWGYNKAIPIDTIGLLTLFGVVFNIGVRSEYMEENSPPHVAVKPRYSLS